MGLTTIPRGLVFVVLAGACLFGAAIPDRIEVRGDSITLADLIADPSRQDEAIRLGYAPNPGHYRWISKAELTGMLSRAGVDPGRHQLPDRLLVTRVGARIEDGRFEAAVAQYYRDTYPGFVVEIESLESPGKLVVPEGQMELRVDPRGAPSRLDGVTLKLDLFIEGRFIRSHWARVRGKARGNVLVARTALRFDQAVNLSDLTVESRELVDLDGCLTRLDEAGGLVARRDLGIGEVLRAKDFRLPVWVKAGDVVTLVAEGPAFSISASAKARQAGRQGESILVQNLDSKQVVSAVVVAPGEVRIRIPGGR